MTTDKQRARAPTRSTGIPYPQALASLKLCEEGEHAPRGIVARFDQRRDVVVMDATCGRCGMGLTAMTDVDWETS